MPSHTHTINLEILYSQKESYIGEYISKVASCTRSADIVWLTWSTTMEMTSGTILIAPQAMYAATDTDTHQPI